MWERERERERESGTEKTPIAHRKVVFYKFESDDYTRSQWMNEWMNCVYFSLALRYYYNENITWKTIQCMAQKINLMLGCIIYREENVPSYNGILTVCYVSLNENYRVVLYWKDHL